MPVIPVTQPPAVVTRPATTSTTSVVGTPAAAVTHGPSWDYAPKTSGGVFWTSATNSDPVDCVKTAAKTYPGAKTFLWYKSIAATPRGLPPEFFAAAKTAGVVPQVGFESGDLTLPQVRRALEGQGRLPETSAANKQANQTYTQLTAWADYLKDKGPVIFRPLSEMNDASGSWEMGKAGNTPEDFAKVWNDLHGLFEARGATNLRWSFDVLAVGDSPMRADLVKRALKAIPAKNIDNVAMNPYAMQSGGQFESFASLCKPWLKVFKDTGHGGTRPVISEMGVSNNSKGHNVAGNKDPEFVKPGTAAYQAIDAKRAAWIHDAFTFARANDFASVTYFSQMNTNWRVDAGSLAEKALKAELAKK